MVNDRTIPPGKDRIAAAASAGRFARSNILSAGIVLVGCAAVLSLLGDHIAESLKDLVANGITEAIAGRPNSTAAVSSALTKGLVIWAPIAGAALLLGLTAISIPAIISKRSGARTAVPFFKVPRSRALQLTVKTAGALVILIVSIQVMKSLREPIVKAMIGTGTGAEIQAGLIALIMGGGAVMILIGLIEIAIKRHAIWRSLHLNRQEAMREQRAAGGDRTVKSESQRRARREAAR